MLTGRYAANVGLIFAMVPGTPAGLPSNIPTMPQLLKEEGYHTAMVGKWHLGHSQWKQTPVGRGFDEHIGNYMWDIDSYTKQQFTVPWAPLVVDWVHAHANGSYSHYAEDRHSTEAITDGAVKMIQKFGTKKDNDDSDSNSDEPLFLYVAYTAAHSPLQPIPQHEAACAHIPHLWRRQFCGMVVGLDEGIQNISDAIEAHLSHNTVMYVFSDNGGSTYFGGLNMPYRGSKSTPHEGGVKVPAFVVDYTPDHRYIGRTGREYHGLMHSADILPTLLGYAGVPNIESRVPGMDGYDFGPAIRSGSNEGPRSDMLLELYNADEFIFYNETLRAYRMGDMKLIDGLVRDPFMHYESMEDHMNCTDPTKVTRYGEMFNRFFESLFSSGPYDNTRIVVTHQVLHALILRPQRRKQVPTVRLYNLTADPTESNNIAESNMDVVEEIRRRIKDIEVKRPFQQPYWLFYDIETVWPKTFVGGDCSMNKRVGPSECHFTHPWLPDDVDPWKDIDTLTSSVDYTIKKGRQIYIPMLGGLALLGLFLVFCCSGGMSHRRGDSPRGRQKKEQ